MAERHPRSIRKHIRDLKSDLRRNISPQRVQGESSFWDKTEEILSLTLPDYARLYGSHAGILREFFVIRTQTTGNLDKLREELKKFSSRHDKETLDSLKSAFVVITKITKDHNFR